MATSTVTVGSFSGFTAGATSVVSVALSNTPVDFATMNTLAMQAGVAWASSNVDDQMSLNIRIVNGATILAAADAGGTFQALEPIWTNTTSGTTNVVSFTYVNLTADQATWDGASVEVEQVYAAIMKADGGVVSSVGAMTFDIDYDVAVASDDLLADDVEASSEVTTVAIGQTHATLADDVESLSEVTTVPLGQLHGILANDLESASEVSVPTLAEAAGTDELLANDVEATSEVTAVAVGQEHGLLSTSVEAASEVGSPAVGQEHGLLSTSVEATSEVTSPALEEGSTTDALLADDVEATSEVTTSAIGQTHDLLSTGTEATSEVTSPALGEAGGEDALLANDVEAQSEVSTPSMQPPATTLRAVKVNGLLYYLDNPPLTTIVAGGNYTTDSRVTREIVSCTGFFAHTITLHSNPTDGQTRTIKRVGLGEVDVIGNIDNYTSITLGEEVSVDLVYSAADDRWVIT